MSIIEIKFSKFDNTPWGFRLAGGSDFPQPLTVIKIIEGSLAECMGLKPGDVVVRLNDVAVSGMTHGQAHEALKIAGNNFSLSVHRTQEAQQAVDAIQEDNIVPYTIPLEELKPITPESDSSDESFSDSDEEEQDEEEKQEKKELSPKLNEKEPTPVNDNGDVKSNKEITDEEIAQLILEEEELLPAGEQGVLGVNFKKLRPRLPGLKESKVLEELQKLAVEEAPKIQELKRTSTFLQKPERPIPKSKEDNKQANDYTGGYKVIIKKQPKKTVTERLLASGRLEPLKTPEPTMNTPSITPEPTQCSRPESAASRVYEIPIEVEGRESKASTIKDNDNNKIDDNELKNNENIDSKERSPTPCNDDNNNNSENENDAVQIAEPPKPIFDKEKVKELITAEISLEKQLESVQNQLLALKQLPSEIENHLRIVSEQLYKIMELSGVQNGSQSSSRRGSSDDEKKQQDSEIKKNDNDQPESSDSNNNNDDDDDEKNDNHSEKSDNENRSSPATVTSEPPIIIEPEMEQVGPPETNELEVTITDEDHHVKKCVASYETKLFRSREPSPAPSHGSYEVDPNLPAKDQIIQELKHRAGGRKRSKELWPQAKQLELTYGRRWRCPNDFFNDEMIAEVLSGQAEVIRGRALGVNFKKYEKAWLPNYDHLMSSSVYKMLHKMEREPKTGIPARPSKVLAAEDVIESAKSPVF
ncbi:probable serine/threonine-protein kinase DDB_G0286465 [Aphidius gifuensis]|uniref:probable serine/threonine-protein kinase DDB_G0286465 n=1 Tax=Aphidius gifuensis TaxID=684658 RepID=UPI001CDC5AF8|nr:probable serine/threonine-protein kinase DDB_G0286465 [Aphidius gifuensis]